MGCLQGRPGKWMDIATSKNLKCLDLAEILLNQVQQMYLLEAKGKTMQTIKGMQQGWWCLCVKGYYGHDCYQC